MDTNRLSKTIAAALNAQMTVEAHASQIYLSYAAWAHGQGFSGITTFLFRHANEERNHMMKFLEYILKRGGEAKIAAIAAPPENPANINDCFEHIYQHEIDNTKSIYRLVKLCLDEQDWASWDFMQWFVKEQVEEETFAMNLIDKLKMANGESLNSALYELDRDLEGFTGEMKSAEDATAEKP